MTNMSVPERIVEVSVISCGLGTHSLNIRLANAGYIERTVSTETYDAWVEAGQILQQADDYFNVAL